MSNIITRPPWTRQPQAVAPIRAKYGKPLVLINPSNGSRNQIDGSPWVGSQALQVAPSPVGMCAILPISSPAAAIGSVSVPSGADFMAVYYLPFGVTTAAQNSGVFRSATGGDTFCLIKTASGGTTNRPWIRLNTVDVLNASTGPVVPNNRPVCLVFHVLSGNRVDVAWDGAVQHSATHSTATPAFTFTAWGHQVNEQIGSCALGVFLVGTPTGYAAQISANPWQLFAPITRRIWAPVSAATGRTGDLAVTLDAATVSSAGTAALAGALSATLASATLASAGTVALTGALSATMDAATLAATGSLAVSGSGALDVTLDSATLASTGAPAIAAAAGITLDAATLSSASMLALTGAASITIDAATLAADGVGVQVNAGALAVTLSDATCSAAGHVDIAAALGITLADATVAAAGTLAISGAAAITLEGASLSTYGTSGTGIAGALAVTLDSLVIAARGRLQVLGAATIGHGRAASRRPSVTSSRRPTNMGRGTR